MTSAGVAGKVIDSRRFHTSFKPRQDKTIPRYSIKVNRLCLNSSALKMGVGIIERYKNSDMHFTDCVKRCSKACAYDGLSMVKDACA